MPDLRDNPEQMFTPEQNLQRNQAWATPGPYSTQLPGDQENLFQQWVINNQIPFSLEDTQPDYDMRGFWLAQQKGDPNAITTIDPNDGQLHFPDRWKTPYSPTFSSESQWAAPNAPHWIGDQYIGSDGRIIYDDKLGHWYGLQGTDPALLTPPIKKPSDPLSDPISPLPNFNTPIAPLQGVPGLQIGDKGNLLQLLQQLFMPKANPLQVVPSPYSNYSFTPQAQMLSAQEPSYLEGEKIPDTVATNPAIGDLWEKEQQAAGGVNTTTREDRMRDMMQRRLYGDKSKDI